MIQRWIALSVLASIVWLSATGCENSDSGKQEETQVSAKDVKQKVKEAVETSQDFAEIKFDEYSKTVEAKFNTLQKKHAELTAQAKQAGAEANADIHAVLKELDQKKENIQKKTEELKSASGKALRDLKSGIDQALVELEESYDTALARFSKS